ncbi:MAG: RcnB family protein [Pseudomonadota bacterium]
MKTFVTSLLLSAALALPVATLPMAVDAAPKHCPPGHAKKGWCKPVHASYVPRDYRRVTDWYRHELPEPRAGYVYAVVDEEVFLVLEATREIAEAVGAVARVLKY